MIKPRKPTNRKFRFSLRKKPCYLCQMGVNHIDYKDVELLGKYISSHTGKILPRRVTGACTKHQRMVTNAIKRARIVALLPFVKE
ncbi:MAG: 30S ribosomal protein S18 [Mycoplasmataceae bacterium]|jgi:small subunit ribosomal protein S18|nr:30S ribosomal protein S18 [Mycoplasmataceae bacterium]